MAGKPPQKWAPRVLPVSQYAPLAEKQVVGGKDVYDGRLSRDYFRGNRDEFRELCLKIRTKRDGILPFIPNSTQRAIFDSIRKARSEGRRPQIIVLKARQVGTSTAIGGDLFTDAYLLDHRIGIVIADNIDHAKGLFEMQRRFYRNLPLILKPEDMRLDNVGQLAFPWDSKVQVAAEGNVHSMTANAVHFSEFAYYLKPDMTLLEAMPAIPNDPSSLAVIESTANGQGNLFYEMWVEAIERKSRGEVHGWDPIFIAWHQHEEYTMRPEFLPSDVTPDEYRMAKRFGLRMGQIAWRRWCIASNCKGDVDEFEVRFPATWEEAFRRSGRPVFEPEQMDRLLDEAPPRKNEGSIWVTSSPCEIEWDAATKKPVLISSDSGRLRVFKDWNPRHQYIVSADPSEGDKKSDPTPIEVLDQCASLDQVAEWWGRTPPDVLAKYSAYLGWTYGVAKVGGEANNHGILFFATLMEMGYPNIFMRQTHEEDVSGAITLKPGLMATNKSKHAAIGTFRQWLREKKGLIHSPILLGEMGTAVYFRREQTTMGTTALTTQITKAANKHIDAVMAFAWALWMHRGSETAPLLPMPELELISAYEQVQNALERDPERATELALDLTGMTVKDLDRALEARHQAAMQRDAAGHATER